MAENPASTSPTHDRYAPGRRLAAVADPAFAPVSGDAIARERGDAATGEPSRRLHSVCAGRVTWMTAPEREVSQCVLPRGHHGDHRDSGGYPWNEARWAD
jgi:hypothetical protein